AFHAALEVAPVRRRALAEHGLLRRRLELEHVQRIGGSRDDAVRAERLSPSPAARRSSVRAADARAPPTGWRWGRHRSPWEAGCRRESAENWAPRSVFALKAR